MVGGFGVLSLVGLPGTGKTTVGRQIAKRLGIPFFDSDHVIEQRMGCSIGHYFATHGEGAFRELEEAVIAELTEDRIPKVLATGGGAVISRVNRDRLATRTKVVYLHSKPDELIKRLRNDSARPLLQVVDPLGKLRELYVARDPLYREISRFVVETGRPTAAALTNMVLMQLELA